jgi:xanthine dehydrogenase YagS FAD-binding subunit
MKKFAHFNALTVDEAVSILKRYGGNANLVAGGTDIVGKMKDQILPTYPEALVNLKTIQGMDAIREEGGMLKVGAMAILEDIAHHAGIRERYTALAEAAGRCASPHLREMGTLAGNLCQDIRCWYYRHPDNRFSCLRKRGSRCYALEGDNRYHSIYGGSVEEGCVAVHPSDTAPALIALDASIRTSKRAIKAENFFRVDVSKTTVLDDDEIVTEIQIPAPAKDARSAFLKFALRKSIDFPIVNCAVMVVSSKGKVEKARICLNAVYVTPYRARKAEEAVTGKALTEANAEAAGNAAVEGAKPLKDNAYMVQVARTLVKRAVLSCK